MKKIIALLLTLTLSACVTTPPVPKQSAATLAATHGYVYTNFPKGEDGSMMVISPTQTKGQYSLIARDDKNTHAYGYWLPAGEYKMSKWGTLDWGNYPSFQVKAGQITNLGSFIPLGIGGYEFVILPIKHKESSSLVNAALTEFKPYLASSEIISWDPKVPPTPIKYQPTQTSGLGMVVDLMNAYHAKVNKPSINKQLRETKNIDTFFSIAKSSTPPINTEPAIDKNSTLYYGADFGQIRTRTKNGEWSALDTNTLTEVTSIEIFQNTIVAGHEDGVIQISTDNGKIWKKIHALASDEIIKDIDRVGDEWFVVTKTDKKIVNNEVVNLNKQKIYRSNNGELNNLTLLKEFSHDYGWPGSYGESDSKFYYVPMYTDLYRFNIKTQEWKLITPGKAIHTFHLTDGTNIITSWLAGGAFSKLHLSTDNGDNWKELDTPPYTIDNIYFTSPTEGKATRLGMGMFQSTLEEYAYNSTNNNWTKTREGPAGCAYFLQDETKQTRFCVMPGGNIFSNKTTDNKWAAEFIVD